VIANFPRKALEDEFLSAVGREIHSFGFSGKARQRSFHKKTPIGSLALHFPMITHPDDFDVLMHMSVRFDEIEDLVNRQERNLSARKGKQTSSLGVELGNLTEGRNKRWTIQAADQLPIVVADIMSCFRRHAVPYYAEYGDMQRAFDTLSRFDRSAWLHSPIDHLRAKRVIAFAIALRKHSDFERLVAEQTNYLKEHAAADLDDFTEFAGWLRNRAFPPSGPLRA
jgi:hypothetical protein